MCYSDTTEKYIGDWKNDFVCIISRPRVTF
jgi:hypothetical protein